MAARFVYGVLFSLTLSMLLFVGGFLCFRLGFAALTTLFYAIAGKIMLTTFAILLLAAVAAALMAMLDEVRGYCRREAAALRQVLAVQNRKRHLAQRFVLEIRQIQLLSHARRQRLLHADNQKQLRELYKNIARELESARPQMSADCFTEMRNTLRRHRKHADFQAMLSLRERITCS